MQKRSTWRDLGGLFAKTDLLQIRSGLVIDLHQLNRSSVDLHERDDYEFGVGQLRLP